MPDELERNPVEDEAESSDGIGVVRAREMLGELVLRAGFGNERVILTRKGKPTAAIVGMRDLDRLKEWDKSVA